MKRPDAVQTFDYLAKLELWNGNSNGIHENSTAHRKNHLQNQLTQVTDELNQLKSQLSTSPKDAEVNHMNSECENFTSSTVSQSSLRSSFNIDDEQSLSTTTTISSTSVKTQIGCLTENDEKDRQISFLTNKLNESDKETNDLRKEVERLRDIIIKQRNG